MKKIFFTILAFFSLQCTAMQIFDDPALYEDSDRLVQAIQDKTILETVYRAYEGDSAGVAGYLSSDNRYLWDVIHRKNTHRFTGYILKDQRIIFSMEASQAKQIYEYFVEKRRSPKVESQ